MKKAVFMFLGFWVYQMNAQEYKASAGLSLGQVDDGMGIMADYNYYLDGYGSLHAAAAISFAEYKHKEIKVPYALYAVQVGYTRHVWENYNHKIKASVLGGLLAGYEVINNGDREVSASAVVKDKSKFIMGPYVGGEINFLLNRDSAIIVRGNECLHINSDAGKWTPYIGVGIRYLMY